MVSCGFPLHEDCTVLMEVSMTVLGNDKILTFYLKLKENMKRLLNVL